VAAPLFNTGSFPTRPHFSTPFRGSPGSIARYRYTPKVFGPDFLSRTDLAISGLRVEKSAYALRVRAVHEGADGRSYELLLNEESAGMRKLCALYWHIDSALRYGHVLIVDDLDKDLHPLLLRYLANQFHAAETGAQLAFTAHDVSLLDRKYLRADQVWFAMKDEGGACTLRSLAEYRLRDVQAFDSAYLGGSFGAIPDLT